MQVPVQLCVKLVAISPDAIKVEVTINDGNTVLDDLGQHFLAIGNTLRVEAGLRLRPDKIN